jgi:hypothetical protein
VSEKFYGAAECYGNNEGDSAVTMARIAWADGHARRVLRDWEVRRCGARARPAEACDGGRRAQGYEAKIMAPIRARFFADTWMFERHAPTPRSARGARARCGRAGLAEPSRRPRGL